MRRSPILLSKLRFGSCLAYSPHGESDEAKRSRTVCYAIKQDGYVQGHPVIALGVTRLKENLTLELEDLLAPDVLLVPTPRSAPFSPKQRDILWVPRRICEELIAAGFGQSWEPCLVRHQAVPKSAYASRGLRPGFQTQHDSMRVDRLIGDRPRRILLVDDVITKGATVLAGASLLAEAFPGIEVVAFAMVRTMGWAFEKIVDPVCGEVKLGKYGAYRVP